MHPLVRLQENWLLMREQSTEASARGDIDMRIQIEARNNEFHILFARQYWPATDHWHSGSRLQLVRELTEMHGKSVQLFVLIGEFAL